MKYQMKPTQVEAMQWTGRNGNEVKHWMTSLWGKEPKIYFGTEMLTIEHTNEHETTLHKNDWLVVDSLFDFSKMTNDLFNSTYEMVTKNTTIGEFGTIAEEYQVYFNDKIKSVLE